MSDVAVKDREAKKRLKKRGFIAVAAVLLVLVAVVVIILVVTGRKQATTMSINDYKGDVALTDNAGAVLELWKDRRLADGNVLKTKVDSRADVLLDQDRLFTLMQQSAAEFHQKKRVMELSLTEGRCFFNIIRQLEEDESLDIHTSTVTLSIRGTSGYVDADENGSQVLYLTSGKIHFVASSPVTGETEEDDVHAGQKLTVTVLSDGSLEVKIEDIPRTALPKEAEDMIASDPVLLATVLAETGWENEEAEKAAVSENGLAETEEGDGPLLRIPETVVDGVLHRAYYEFDLSEETENWLDELIAACEAGDKEKAAVLCGYDHQNPDERHDIDIELKDLEKEYPDKISSYGFYHFWYNGYKCCVYMYPDTWSADVFLLPENGMGYNAVGEWNEGKWTYWYFCQCPCVDGMFNGDMVAESRIRPIREDRREWNNSKIRNGRVVNGLYEGTVTETEKTYHGLFDNETEDSNYFLITEEYERGIKKGSQTTEADSNCVFFLGGSQPGFDGVMPTCMTEYGEAEDIYPF